MQNENSGHLSAKGAGHLSLSTWHSPVATDDLDAIAGHGEAIRADTVRQPAPSCQYRFLFVRRPNLLVTPTPSHDPKIEGDVRMPATRLMNFERSRGLLGHV